MLLDGYLSQDWLEQKPDLIIEKHKMIAYIRKKPFPKFNQG